MYLGVSGGAMCLSYYLSQQANTTYKIMQELSQDEQFISIWQIMEKEGYVNLEYLREYSQSHYPLHVERAMQQVNGKFVAFVATDIGNGSPTYLSPDSSDWLNCLKATAALPFVTKASVNVKGKKMMDGGWSDPIPVKKAVELGAKKIVVIRTAPKNSKQTWSWLGKIGSWYHRNNPKLSYRFSKDYEYYNESVDYANTPPKGIKVIQIAPPGRLATSDYSSTLETLKKDYNLGVALGSRYLKKHLTIDE